MRLIVGLVVFMNVMVAGVNAQTTPDDSLHKVAVQYLYNSDYPNAMRLLKQAAEINGKNIAVLNDIATVYFMQNEFKEGYQFIRPVAQSDIANESTYQIAAMLLRGGKNVREADMAYKVGLKTFPNSGLLLADYGDFLQQADPESDAPVKLWERGIASDPNFSGNYYFAGITYANQNKLLRAILYTELFINLESYTDRSLAMKEQLLELYRRYYSLGAPVDMAGNDFERQVATLLTSYKPLVAGGITADNISAIRSRFIVDWFGKGLNSTYPSALFDMHRLYMRKGIFDAYNQWIFLRAANQQVFQNWTQMHPVEYVDFNTERRETIFKIPPGQYYQ